MIRALAALSFAGFVLILNGATPASAEICATNRYASTGALRSTVYSDCVSGKRFAKSKFWD